MEEGVCGVCHTPFSDDDFDSDEEVEAEDAEGRL
jgi:hypothetical protein